MIDIQSILDFLILHYMSINFHHPFPQEQEALSKIDVDRLNLSNFDYLFRNFTNKFYPADSTHARRKLEQLKNTDPNLFNKIRRLLRQGMSISNPKNEFTYEEKLLLINTIMDPNKILIKSTSHDMFEQLKNILANI